MGPYRSFLFAPGNHPRKVAKVFDVATDAVILDLEDAVAKEEKVATRPVVVEALQRPRRNKGYVRVNSYGTSWCYGDIVSIVGPWLDGVVLPMTENADQVRSVDWLLRNLERDSDLTEGAIDLIPLIETAKGVLAVDTIAAACPRVRRLAFGAGDYSLDLNIRWSLQEPELADARARIVLGSRAAGIEAPIDTVWVHIRDLENLRASAVVARNMGFQGKLCIYPPQVDVVNEVFTPTAEEVAHAERVIAAFEEAERQGSSSIQLDGYFIDYPIVYKAQRTLDAMRRIRNAEEHACC